MILFNAKKVKTYFTFSLIAGLFISAILAIWLFLFGSLDIKIILTTLTIGICSTLGLSCAAIINKKPYQFFGVLGISIIIISFILLTIIWGSVN